MMALCHVYGWTPDQVRGLRLADYFAAIAYANEVSGAGKDDVTDWDGGGGRG